MVPGAPGGAAVAVEFVAVGDEIRVRKLEVGHTRGQRIVERLKRASDGDVEMSTEEIMRLTRGGDWGTGRLEDGYVDPR